MKENTHIIYNQYYDVTFHTLKKFKCKQSTKQGLSSWNIYTFLNKNVQIYWYKYEIKIKQREQYK